MPGQDPSAALVVEGATSGEAKWRALKELELRFPGLVAENVDFVVERDESPDGDVPARVKATVDVAGWREREAELEIGDDPAERVREFLRRVAAALGLWATVSVEDGADELVGRVEGADLGLFIGKHGQTIDAVQYVASRVAYRGMPAGKRVVVDAAGYRERRAGAVRRHADRAVGEAMRQGRSVELQAMSAWERRVVHTYLSDRPDVETHSEGDEPDRRVIVSPVRMSI